MDRTNIFVGLVGISGVGKSAIAAELAKYHGFALLPSYTTRQRRPGDNDEELRFITDDDFIRRAHRGDFLETARHGEHWYALAKTERPGPYVSPINADGIQYLFKHEEKHGLKVVPVGIVPPDMTTLMARNQATPGFSERAARDHHHGTTYPPRLHCSRRYEMMLINRKVKYVARLIDRLVDVVAELG